MEPKNNAENTLAVHLIRPFMLPGQSGQPLSKRVLADGGMVVIASDGRKLWFTAGEVAKACRELRIPASDRPREAIGLKKPVLIEKEDIKNPVTSRPSGGQREGYSEMISLPEDLKHLERKSNDYFAKYQKPSSRGS
jgi:hypothetical protein